MNSLLALVGSTTIDRLQFGYSSMSESKRVVVTDIIDDDEFEEFESESITLMRLLQFLHRVCP